MAPQKGQIVTRIRHGLYASNTNLWMWNKHGRSTSQKLYALRVDFWELAKFLSSHLKPITVHGYFIFDLKKTVGKNCYEACPGIGNILVTYACLSFLSGYMIWTCELRTTYNRVSNFLDWKNSMIFPGILKIILRVPASPLESMSTNIFLQCPKVQFLLLSYFCTCRKCYFMPVSTQLVFRWLGVQ